MTVDFRAIVACDLGVAVSGDVGSNHISDRTGLKTWSGRIQFDGIVNPARGTALQLLVACPQTGKVSRFPVPLRVIRAVTYPLERRSEIEVGCILTLMKERKDQAEYFANQYTPSWYTDAINAGYSKDAIGKFAPVPIYAQQMLQFCLGKIGINLAANSRPLTAVILRNSIDLTRGYVQIIGDLIRSECCFGRILPDETLQVVPLELNKGGKGPILRAENLASIEPITTGREPADKYIVKYQAVEIKLPPSDKANPNDSANRDVKYSNNNPSINYGPPADPAAPAAIGSDWTESETVSPPNIIVINYTRPLPNGKKERKTATLISTTRATSTSFYTPINYFDESNKQQQRDVLIKKIDTTWTTIASVNQAYVSWRLTKAMGLPAGGAKSINITTYKYYLTTDGPQLYMETTEQYVSEAQFAGGLQIENYDTYSPGGESMVLSHRTIREVLATKTGQGRDYTQTRTSRWMARGETSEGKTEVAAFIRAAKALIAETPGIVGSLVATYKPLVFEGTEVQNETGRLPVPSKPTDQEIAAGRLMNDRQVPETITSAAPQNTNSAAKVVASADYQVNQLSTVIGNAVFDGANITNPIETVIATYEMPYAPDDYYYVTPTGYLIFANGRARAAAERFGRLESAMDSGHAYGHNITTGWNELPSLDMAPLYIRQAGIEAAFLVDSTAYAWDRDGMVASADLMLLGATGWYGSAPPAGSWVRLPVPPAGLSSLGGGTVETSPSKANTIAIPSGFDPTSPAAVFTALPDDGSDVFKEWRQDPAIIGPSLEFDEATTLTRAFLEDVDYDYQIIFEVEESATFTLPQLAAEEKPVVPVMAPLSAVVVAALAPTVEATGASSVVAPVAVVEITAPVPRVVVDRDPVPFRQAGTAAPLLGDGQVSPTTAATGSGWTLVFDDTADEASTEVGPFGFAFTLNEIAYTSCYVNSNAYITFGDYEDVYEDLGATVPALPKIHIGSGDFSYQRIYTRTRPGVFTIRWEGNSAYGADAGDSNRFLEVTFYKPLSNGAQLLDIRSGDIDGDISGPFMIATASTALASGSFAANQSWALEGNATGTIWTLYAGEHVSIPAVFAPAAVIEVQALVPVVDISAVLAPLSVVEVVAPVPFVASEPYRVAGAAIPLLGSGQASTPLPSGWVTIFSGAADEQIFDSGSFGFNVTVAGTAYSNCYISSNHYLIFGSAYQVQYSYLLGESGLPGLNFAANNNSVQAIYTKTTSRYFAIRFEGNNQSGGQAPTATTPSRFVEITFWKPLSSGSQFIEVRAGNATLPQSNLMILFNGYSQLAWTYITGGQSYVFEGNATGTSWQLYESEHVITP